MAEECLTDDARMPQELRDEIERIIDSPYAVSLKHLRDLTQDIEPSVLESWATAFPCHVPGLVTAFLHSLSNWSCTIDVFGTFVPVKSVRDEALRQQPALLDNLLNEALSSERRFLQYSTLCVTFLSTPLPATSSIPASLATFFTRVLRHASDSPSVTSLRSVYALQSGSASSLISTLPAESIRAYFDRLLYILKSFDKQSLSLLCLGSFAKLLAAISSNQTTSPYGSSPSTASAKSVQQSSGTIFEPIWHFFSGRKASKTLELAVLRALQACSESGKLTRAEALEDLHLATVIVSAVEPSQRCRWLEDVPPSLRKLWSKIRRVGLDPDIRLKAIELLTTFEDVRAVSDEVVEVFHILTVDQRALLCPPLFSSLRKSARILAPRFTVLQVTAVLQHALKSAEDERAILRGVPDRFWSCQGLIDGLVLAVHTTPSLSDCINGVLATNELSSPLQSFIKTSGSAFSLAPNLDTCRNCPTALLEARRTLCASLCRLILTSALQRMGVGAGLEITISSDLLRKQEELAVPHRPCLRSSRHLRTDQGNFLLNEQSSKPASPGSSHGWRQSLSQVLASDVERQNERLLRYINDICQDLEARCYEVETPLRQANTHAEQLESRLKEMGDQVVELTTQSELQLTKLGALEKAHAQLQDCLTQSESAISKQVCIIEDRELQIKAMVTAHAEAVEQLQHASATSELENRDLQAEITIIRQRCDVIQTASRSLTKTSGERMDQLQRLEGCLDRKDGLLEELEAEKVSFQTDAETLRRSCEDLTTEVHSLRQQMRCCEGKKQQELQASETILETTKSGHDAELEEIKVSHARAVEAAQARLTEVQKEAEHDSERNEARIYEFKSQIAKLHRERKVQAQEFAHAQSLNRRLLSAMSIHTDKAPIVREIIEPIDESGRPEQARRAQVTVSTRPADKTTGKTDSDARKSRRSENTAILRSKALETSTLPTNASPEKPSGVQRRPLAPLVDNLIRLPPSEVVNTTMNNWEELIKLGDLMSGDLNPDDFSFDGSELPTSTSRVSTLYNEAGQDLDVYDDTTMEIL